VYAPGNPASPPQQIGQRRLSPKPLGQARVCIDAAAGAAPTAWGRLGHVLNWAGIAAGLAFGGFIAFAINSLGIGWQIVFGGGLS